MPKVPLSAHSSGLPPHGGGCPLQLAVLRTAGMLRIAVARQAVNWSPVDKFHPASGTVVIENPDTPSLSGFECPSFKASQTTSWSAVWSADHFRTANRLLGCQRKLAFDLAKDLDKV